MVAVIIFLAYQYRSLPQSLQIQKFSNDFDSYWAAERLNLEGKNPYSEKELRALQSREICSDCSLTILSFYPPWFLAFILPFAVLPFITARLLWFFLTYLAFVGSAIWIWNIYGGNFKYKYIALLLIITFTPALFSLFEGNATPLVLLGIAGFLYSIKVRHWWLAGFFTTLISLKPHLLFLFWPALILWIIKDKRWEILAGFVLSTGIVTLIASFNTGSVPLIQNFLKALVSIGGDSCKTATITAVLCKSLGTEKLWPQFIIPLLGIIWLIYYWLRYRDSWQWEERLPWIMFVSLITVPYAWMHDGLILILPLLQVAIGLLQRKNVVKFQTVLIIYSIIDVVLLVLIPTLRYRQNFFAWVFWVFLLLYWLLSKRIKQAALIPSFV